jgi:hypothetical protein
LYIAVTTIIFDCDIAAIIIFSASFTTTTNKHIVINVDLNVCDKGADESQEQQMKYVPGHRLRGVLNKTVVAAAKRGRAKQHYG